MNTWKMLTLDYYWDWLVKESKADDMLPGYFRYELANQIHKECKDWKYIIELNRIITWLGSVPS